MNPEEPDEQDVPEALPSLPSSGSVIAGVMGTLDQALTNRRRPVTQIEEQYADDWNSLNGLTVDGLDEPVDRPEPPDRSGARL